LEPSELFERTLGADSDIVSKEMYTFSSPGSDERVTLRPEGTAGVIRAFLASALSLPLPQKYYYCGPMFRRERPQKGRLRQFHQFGVECVGSDSVFTDLEIIDMGWQLLRRLKVDSKVELHLNSLGDPESRTAYRTVLERYFKDHINILSANSKMRLEKGAVLRILDSKEKEDHTLIQDAPSLLNHLSPASTQRFQKIQSGLEVLGIPYTLDPKLVRGLDYYGETVFEFVTTQLGAQGTVLAGGRYDRLVSVMGHTRPIPGIGWASGIERLVMLAAGGLPTARDMKPVVVVSPEEHSNRALRTAHDLREQGFEVWSWLWLPPKKQLAKAATEGASYAVFIAEGDQDLTLRNLATRKEGQAASVPAISELLRQGGPN